MLTGLSLEKQLAKEVFKMIFSFDFGFGFQRFRVIGEINLLKLC